MADPTSSDSLSQQTQPNSDPAHEPPSTSANNNNDTSSSDTLTMNQEHDIDAEISNPTGDTTMSLSNDNTTQQDPPPSADQQQPNGLHPVPHPTAVPQPRLPQKKDATLRDFLAKMDDQYTPLIPDAVTDYYLTLAGLPPPSGGSNGTDRRLARLLALATQKFVADVAADAYQYSRIRSTNTTSNNPLTGLGGAAGFGTMGGGGGGADEGAGGGGGKGGKKDAAGKSAPLGDRGRGLVVVGEIARRDGLC